MTFDIRSATLDDKQPFLDLLEQLFDSPGSRPPGYTRERGSEGFRAAVTNPESDVLLAFDRQALVGLANVYRVGTVRSAVLAPGPWSRTRRSLAGAPRR